MRALPTADRFLAGFADERRAMTPAAQHAALDRVLCDLRLAVELEGEALLDADDAVLLDAERQFERPGAVARVLGLADLARVLERYVGDPLYRPDGQAEARLRVETCGALLRRLAIEPVLDGRARLLRRADEAIRMEAGAIGPLRRLRPRRARS